MHFDCKTKSSKLPQLVNTLLSHAYVSKSMLSLEDFRSDVFKIVKAVHFATMEPEKKTSGAFGLIMNVHHRL